MAISDRKYLRTCLEAFSDCTGVPVTLFSPEGEVLEELRADEKFCQFFPHYRKTDSECVQNLVFSANLSYEMGEPYIYYCPVGLTHIAVPIIENGHFEACAVAGPFAMGEIDSRLLNQALALDPSRSEKLTDIALFTAKMRHFPPAVIQKLSTMLYSAVLFSRKDRGDYAQINARHRQQLDMGEQIKMRKRSLENGETALSQNELRAAYLEALRARNTEQASAFMDRILTELILLEGGNFDTVKMQLLELFLVLSRSAMESGVPMRQIFGSDLDFLTWLNRVDKVEGLTEWASRLTVFFAEEIFAGVMPLSAVTGKAVNYLSEHYMEKITLRDLATALFVSDSYLSKLFRQELNTSFTNYLNQLRIDHSVDLMQSSEHSLLEIAGMVGFEDQSYFTKVFKRITGQTPRQYKSGLKEKEKEGSKA